MKAWMVGLGLLLSAGLAMADTPPEETATLGEAKVTIYTWDFLTEDELATLRLVLVNQEALELFVPTDAKGSFAAFAVSPDDGFIRDGALSPSATAIGGIDAREAALTAAMDACDKARKGAAPCEIVLVVEPE